MYKKSHILNIKIIQLIAMFTHISSLRKYLTLINNKPIKKLPNLKTLMIYK